MGSGEPIRGMEYSSVYYDHHFQQPEAVFEDGNYTGAYKQQEIQKYNDNGDGYGTSGYHCRKLGFPLCSFKTTLSELAEHLICDHLVDGVADSSLTVEQSILNETGTGSILFRPHYLEAFGRWFILISGYNKYQGLYFWNVKCIQYDDDDPVEFCSKLELFSAYNTGKNIVWQAPVFGLEASRPQSTLSSLVIREEIMPEFQYTETDDYKISFCGGDSKLIVPGWRIRVSIMLNSGDTDENLKTLSENGTHSMMSMRVDPHSYSMGRIDAAARNDTTIPRDPVKWYQPAAEKNIVVSRLVDEKESEYFFQAKKHDGIVCKGCSWENFQGVRYSCVYCSNYHICTFCMKSGVHSEHIMIRVMNPEQNEQAECFLKGLKNGVMDNSIQG